MLDTTPLTDAVDRFADRLRSAPQSKLQRGAAAEALALARELSVRAQRLEGALGEGPAGGGAAAGEAAGGGPAGGGVAGRGVAGGGAVRADAADAPRLMPDAGVFVVADQLTVAAGDLSEALRTAPSAAELDEAVRSVERAAARARL